MRRILWAALAALFFCGAANAQMVRRDGIVLNPQGRPVPNATVRVCTGAAATPEPVPCSPQATVYTAEDGLTVKASVTTDAFGNYFYYAPTGTYKEQISGSGIATSTTPDIPIVGPVTGTQWADGGYVTPGATGGTVTPTASAPQLSQESATGGSIADDTYYCVTTLVNLNSSASFGVAAGETTPSPEQTITISAGTGTAQLLARLTGNEWRTGAFGFRLWCGTVSGGPYYLQAPKTHAFTMDTDGIKRRPTSVSVATISRTSNVTTVTTSANHNMNVGEVFQIASVTDSTYNGNFAVATTSAADTLTYYNVGTDGSSSSGTVTPQLGGFVTITLSSGLTVAGLGLYNGQDITIAGATGCTDNPNGSFRVYDHTATGTAGSVTFKSAGANETGCGGAAIVLSWTPGFSVGTTTNVHLVHGDFIVTSIAGSSANPPSTNTTVIDDVQVAQNSTYRTSTLAAGNAVDSQKAVQLAEGNDTVSSALRYNLTTPFIIGTSSRVHGNAGGTLSTTNVAGTQLVCTTTQNALWNQVYDKIGCVMTISSNGSEMRDVNIISDSHSVVIYNSLGGSESSNRIIFSGGTWQTNGAGANSPAPLRTFGPIYYGLVTIPVLVYAVRVVREEMMVLPGPTRVPIVACGVLASCVGVSTTMQFNPDLIVVAEAAILFTCGIVMFGVSRMRQADTIQGAATSYTLAAFWTLLGGVFFLYAAGVQQQQAQWEEIGQWLPGLVVFFGTLALAWSFQTTAGIPVYVASKGSH